jgi:signal transduction histidine kinase
LALLGLSQGRAFFQILEEPGRLREAVYQRMHAAIAILRSQEPRACVGESPHDCLRKVLRLTPPDLASEMELFDAAGQRVASIPNPAPVEHRLDAKQRRTVEQGQVLVLGPVPGREPRLLAYFALPGLPGAVVRTAADTPGLVENLRGRRALLLGHLSALVVLFLGIVLALLPGRDAPEPRRQEGLAPAFQEAMARLRRSGEERTREHAEQVQRLEDAARDLEAMARAGEMTAGMVHEVRNGLGTIVGYARLIERDASAAGEAALAVREECAALEQVIQRFAEFTRPEQLRREPLSVAALLSRVAAREMRSRPGAQVEVEAPPALTIEADEALLARAIENLLRNARDAAGPAGRVHASARSNAQEVEIAVADNGPGMPESERARIRPFHTNKAGGFGLGLALVKKIVALHGGVVTLEQEQPRGLRARIRLPSHESAIVTLGSEREVERSAEPNRSRSITG